MKIERVVENGEHDLWKWQKKCIALVCACQNFPQILFLVVFFFVDPLSILSHFAFSRYMLIARWPTAPCFHMAKLLWNWFARFANRSLSKWSWTKTPTDFLGLGNARSLHDLLHELSKSSSVFDTFQHISVDSNFGVQGLKYLWKVQRRRSKGAHVFPQLGALTCSA